MTVEEAKAKWCPFARVASGINRVSNPHDHMEKQAVSGCMCIADGCMAWRWNIEERAEVGGYASVSPSATHGYCGLAH